MRAVPTARNGAPHEKKGAALPDLAHDASGDSKPTKRLRAEIWLRSAAASLRLSFQFSSRLYGATEGEMSCKPIAQGQPNV